MVLQKKKKKRPFHKQLIPLSETQQSPHVIIEFKYFNIPRKP